MAKTTLLKAELRERTGTNAVQKVRKEGRIPAIVYGHKQTPVAISLDAHNFVEVVHHGHRLIEVQIEKKKEKIIVKDLQYDHLSKNIIHADLMRVDITEAIKVNVPIELKGASVAKGTHEGGIIEEHADHLEIECKATDIPETIVVLVKDVGVGDSLHASDITLPEGVKLISPPETLLVTCHLVAAAKTTEQVEEEIPTAPEVITEAKRPEEEGSKSPEDKK
ncbi:MAG: 50S ribosomal protein L25 [Planctomycetes bacterium]|nr:50S ribosomal protein L25 [Planctomycetota bacterium]MBL7143279.1 50S ribosomal protein L25 [Phycisphaerae bacterium]